MQNGHDKLDHFEECCLKSPTGMDYNYWLPIYINADHFKRASVTIMNSLCVIAYGSCEGTPEKDFKKNPKIGKPILYYINFFI